MNKIRKGEVKIYKGKEYIAIPEIEEESCTGCCFYDKGICSIDHANDPNCLHSGMIWEQKERYGRMRDRRMTMSIFPSRIIIRRSYSQKVLSVD